LIVTVVRRGELLGARWNEIDRNQAVWTIPADRMKSYREHRVPLPDPALTVLDALGAVRRNDLLFPGARQGRPIAATVVLDLMRELRPGMTLHGLRATFRTWAAEATSIRADIAEACLAHVVEGKVAQAYQRGDILQLRAALMEQWACFLTGTLDG
jgi:integrase